jgi:hypothetical protein
MASGLAGLYGVIFVRRSDCERAMAVRLGCSTLGRFGGLIAAGTGPRPPANPINAQAASFDGDSPSAATADRTGGSGLIGFVLPRCNIEAVFARVARNGAFRTLSSHTEIRASFLRRLPQSLARPPPNSLAAAKPPGEAHSPFIYDDLAGVTRANRFNLSSLCDTVGPNS